MKITLRQQEIIDQYRFVLDKHMADLRYGKVDKTFEIKDLAEILCIHPTHLSNAIHRVLGKSPCDIFEEKFIVVVKDWRKRANTF
jgi:AraC family transcriptional regulator, regulatory protein of adaptative response / methylphosphotriester-DNA alkyltransferase methyltransferase